MQWINIKLYFIRIIIFRYKFHANENQLFVNLKDWIAVLLRETHSQTKMLMKKKGTDKQVTAIFCTSFFKYRILASNKWDTDMFYSYDNHALNYTYKNTKNDGKDDRRLREQFEGSNDWRTMNDDAGNNEIYWKVVAKITIENIFLSRNFFVCCYSSRRSSFATHCPYSSNEI